MKTLALLALTFLFANAQPKPPAELTPEPAVPAILAAFDQYNVVGMPAAHGLKDLDDLILTLIRDPRFPKKVNDIEIECGNALYQDLLDRYTSGADVSFHDVQKVWRNTSQPACGLSGFYEQLVPLVRVINQHLPRDKGLRLLAGDPPLDWDQIKTADDLRKAMLSLRRDTSISSVLEKEVLLKHRKALLLAGTIHLFHGQGRMNSIFVISELGTFDTNLADLSQSAFAGWPIPAVARIKDTPMGKLGLGKFQPPPMTVDQDCNPHTDFTGPLQRPVEELFDAVLYLGPQDLRLWEKLPADIVLDSDYRKELSRRAAPVADALERQALERAANPIFQIFAPPIDPKGFEQAIRDCHERQRQLPPK